MENLTPIGDFLSGLGLLLLSFGVFWFVSGFSTGWPRGRSAPEPRHGRNPGDVRAGRNSTPRNLRIVAQRRRMMKRLWIEVMLVVALLPSVLQLSPKPHRSDIEFVSGGAGG